MTEETRERIENVGAKVTYTILGAALAMGIAWGGLIVRVARLETDVSICSGRGMAHESRIAVVESRVEGWR